MKKRLLLPLWLLLPCLALANHNYATGDTLYVWAMPELNLRSAPSPVAPLVGKLSYGARVTVTSPPDSLFIYAFSVEMFKLDTSAQAGWRGFWGGGQPAYNSIDMNGHWVKVNWKGLNGYVFDGYLSRLPAIQYHQATGPGLDPMVGYLQRESFKDYAAREFGILEAFGNDTLYDEHDHRFARYVFRGGIINMEEGGSNWSSSQFVLPGYSLEDGILFINRFLEWERYPDDKALGNWPANCWIILDFDNSNTLKLQLELTEILIEQRGNLLLITFFSSC